MVIVEPVVSEEKLRQLLDEQAESGSLDFKSECDLASKAALVELAKDIGAMQLRGGYIVVGADDRGRPVVGLKPEHLALFDESRLRAKLRKWLPEPLELLAAIHEISGRTLVLLFVGPSPDGWAVFRADGQYESGGRSITAFRKGDVFARHGSASEPWTSDDQRFAFDQVVASRKEEWRRGLAADFAKITEGTQATTLAAAPASALTWKLDGDSFEAALIEQLRAHDDIPMKLLLEGLPVDASLLARQPAQVSDLSTLFDRLVCLAALGIRLDRPSVVMDAMHALGDVYGVGFEIAREPSRWAITAPGFWLQLVERAVGLGALAVRRERWETVRQLAVYRGDGDDWRHWRSWLRHGMTMAARSQLFIEKEDGQEVERSLISLAHRVVTRLDCLRGGLEANDERLLDSLCQFDGLACLAAIAEWGLATSGFYPNFSRFYTHRTEPIFERLLRDDALRRAIFPLSDQELASALRGLDALAHRESLRFAGWDGYTDDRIVRFLKANPIGSPGAD